MREKVIALIAPDTFPPIMSLNLSILRLSLSQLVTIGDAINVNDMISCKCVYQ